MKNRIIIILLTYCLSFQFLFAEDLKITNTQIQKKEDKVDISFQLNLNEWDSRVKLTLIPKIYNDKNSLLLEPLTVVGRKQFIADQRNSIPYNNQFAKVKSYDIIEYTTTIPYDNWMEEISLGVDQRIESCCETEIVPFQEIIEKQLIYYKLIPVFSETSLEYELTELEKFTLDNPFLLPYEDYDKRYDLFKRDKQKESLQVYFKQGIYSIDINFGPNREVLNAIEAAFNLINNTPGARIYKIMIAGFASPEGNAEINSKLADRRAQAVKEFIRTCLPLRYNESVFEFYNGGNDWQGLLMLLERNRHIPGMNEAADIIRTNYYRSDCDNLLKNINGGSTYRYMLNNFYPQLRNAGYVQVYYEIERSAEIATQVFDQNGRSVWIDSESAENMAVTGINKAVNLMKEEYYEEALKLLIPISDDPRSYNYIGVCHMMSNRLDEAEKWLMQAVSLKDKYAKINLDRLKTARRMNY